MKRTQQDLIRVSEEAAAWLLLLQEEDSPETRADFDKWIRRGPENLEEFLLAQMMFAELNRLDSTFNHGSFDGNDSVVGFPNASPFPSPSMERVSTELAGADDPEESPHPASTASLQPSPLGGEGAFDAVSLCAPSPSNGEGRGEEFKLAGEERGGERQLSTRRSWKWISALAASLVVAIGLLIAPWPLGSKVYSTKIGSQEAIKLDDGSVIHLNTQSKARVHFSKDLREVRLLEGEALFTVARDATRPFVVITDTARVRAIGTQFNVYRSGANETKVSVIEGVVQLTASRNPHRSTPPLPSPAIGEGQSEVPSRRGEIVSSAETSSAPSPSHEARRGEAAQGAGEEVVRLAAGDEAAVLGTKIVKARMADPERAVAWRARRLIFPGNPIAEVAEEFNRYSARQIRVEGEAIRSRPMTGVFDADDPSTMIRFLSRDPNVEVIASEIEIVIRPRSSPEQ